jgi:hypothetical protein
VVEAAAAEAEALVRLPLSPADAPPPAADAPLPADAPLHAPPADAPLHAPPADAPPAHAPPAHAPPAGAPPADAPPADAPPAHAPPQAPLSDAEIAQRLAALGCAWANGAQTMLAGTANTDIDALVALLNEMAADAVEVRLPGLVYDVARSRYGARVLFASSRIDDDDDDGDGFDEVDDETAREEQVSSRSQPTP